MNNKVNEKNDTMVIDHYEFTMGNGYFDAKVKDDKAYFDIFFRKNPFMGGYTISGGLDEIIDYINNFKIEDEDIEFLSKKTGIISKEYLEYLKNLRFTGDIYAVPDGTIVFPNEPVITIKANIIEAQLIETALLACFNHGALVTTKAKRLVEAAEGRPIMEFGARRARGKDSAVEVSKYAYIGGFCGTSNDKAARDYDIPALGTMAHSFVTFFDDEYEAFKLFAMSNPNNCTFLVDTYDTLRSGIPNAIRVAKDYLIPNGLKFKGIRIDSGDLAYLSKEARKMLDKEGFTETKICVSNGLDEDEIVSLIRQGAPIDSFGLGDNIAASLERVGGVYKLVAREINEKPIPKIKVSDDSAKTINPGYKKVYRFYDKETGYALGDVIALADETIPDDNYTLVSPTESWKKTTITNYKVRELQVPIFKDGVQVYDKVSINDSREYCQKEIETIYPEIRRSINPHQYYVDLSLELLNLKNSMIEEKTKLLNFNNNLIKNRSRNILNKDISRKKLFIRNKIFHECEDEIENDIKNIIGKSMNSLRKIIVYDTKTNKSFSSINEKETKKEEKTINNNDNNNIKQEKMIIEKLLTKNNFGVTKVVFNKTIDKINQMNKSNFINNKSKIKKYNFSFLNSIYSKINTKRKMKINEIDFKNEINNKGYQLLFNALQNPFLKLNKNKSAEDILLNKNNNSIDKATNTKEIIFNY